MATAAEKEQRVDQHIERHVALLLKGLEHVHLL